MPGHTGAALDRSLVFDKRDFQPRSGITPFVCSTYHDFKEEHAILATKVFPELQSLCESRASYFDPIHLQLDKSSESLRKGIFLNSSLNFIHRCAPFFIGLIGERYGHHRNLDDPVLTKNPDISRCSSTSGNRTPDSINSFSFSDTDSVLSSNSNSNNNKVGRRKSSRSSSKNWWDRNLVTAFKSGYEWVLEELSQYCSVVELQVLEAAFREEQEYCHFYYRQPEHKDGLYLELGPEERSRKLAVYEPESEYCDMKVRELKQRIIKKGHRVQYFHTTAELCGHVLADWKAVIDELCPPLYDHITIANPRAEGIYKDWLIHESYADLKRNEFILLSEHVDLMSDLTQFALTALDDPPEDWDQEDQGNELVTRMRDKKPEYAPAKYTSIYTVVGDRGSGKTSLISHWAKEFAQEYGFIRVFTHYVGCSDSSTDASHMLRRCLAYFSNQLQHNMEYMEESGGVEEESLHSLGELFTAGITHQPCVIIIDGLDDLGKTNINPHTQARQLSWLLYPLPPHVRIIVTTCRSDVSCQKLSRRPDTKLLEMPLLKSENSKTEVLDQYLGLYSDAFPADLKRDIVRCRLAEKPLFLSVLGNDLKQPGAYQRAQEVVESYLESTSIRELMSKVIKCWLDDYSWMTNKNAVISQGFNKNKDTIRETSGWVAETLRLLAVSKHGLTRKEILQMLHHLGYRQNSAVTELDWLVFLDIVKDVVVLESPSGLLSFRHLHVREAVEHSLLSPEAPKLKQEYNVNIVVPKKQPDPSKGRKQIEAVLYHKALANYMFVMSHSERRVAELPWQLLGSKDYKRLKQALCEPSMVLSLYSTRQGSADLLYFWQVLQQHGYDPSSCYTDMMAVFSHANEVPEITITSDNTGINGDNISHSDQTINLELVNDTEMEESSASEEACVADRLGLIVGRLLADLEHYHTALNILTQLHTSLYQRFPLNSGTEHLLCEVQYHISSQLLQLDMLHDSALFYERVISSATDLLAMLLPEQEELHFIELKGKALTQLASLYIIQRKKSEAERALYEAKRCMTKCGCVMGEAQLLLNTGVLRELSFIKSYSPSLDEKEYFRADGHLKEALGKFEKWYGTNHHKVADVLHEYAGLLCNPRNTHRYEKESAEVLYRRALKLREKNYGSTHLIVADTLTQFGKLLKTYKDPVARKEAVTMLKRAYDIRTTQLGPEHPSTKEVYKVLNDLEVAIQYKSLPHKYTESRPNNQLNSSLTWHDHDLQQFQLRFTRKRAKQRNTKLANAIKAVSMFRCLSIKPGGAASSGLASLIKKTKTKDDTDASSKPDDGASDMGISITDTDIGGYTNTLAGDGDLDTILESERSESDRNSEISIPVYGYSENGDGKNDIYADDVRTVDSVNEKESEKSTPRKLTPEMTDSFTDRQEMPESLSVLQKSEDYSDNESDNRVTVHSRPVSRVEIKPVESGDYIDSFSSPRNVSPEQLYPPNIIVKAKILRPQSAPFKMLQKYHSKSLTSSAGSSNFSGSLRVTPVMVQKTTTFIPHAKRQVSSAPPTGQPKQVTITVHKSGPGMDIHKRVCAPPQAHAVHSSNAVSVINGPQADTESLVAAAVPRHSGLRVHHTSAWYHVPGRYATSDNTYPSKRNQSRVVDDAQRKLVKSLKSRSGHGQLLSSKFPTYLGNRSAHF